MFPLPTSLSKISPDLSTFELKTQHETPHKAQCTSAPLKDSWVISIRCPIIFANNYTSQQSQTRSLTWHLCHFKLTLQGDTLALPIWRFLCCARIAISLCFPPWLLCLLYDPPLPIAFLSPGSAPIFLWMDTLVFPSYPALLAFVPIFPTFLHS